jgi:hypothetical protein
MMVRWKRLLNVVCFQAGWFACALGAAHGWPLLGPLMVGALLMLHLPLVPAPRKQARFVLAAMLFGWLIDSGLAYAGVFTFPTEGMFLGPCPVWMAALWANFAGTFHLCLDWLRGRYWLASVLGACGGPLAYYGGQRLGAMQFGSNTTLSIAVITIEWAIVTPGLVYLSESRGLDALRTVTADAQS